MHWTVLIPAKALPGAKSRLAPASSDLQAHRRLVEAIRADTVAAALAAPVVARVVLVVDRIVDAAVDRVWNDRPDVATAVLVQQATGLNAAVREGAAHAAREWPADGVVALVGDLPALRPEELSDTLQRAADVARGFVADAEGTGTTVLTGLPGRLLAPSFGPGSAARHAEIAAPLPAGAGLRRDVDTAADLELAVELGLGRATAAELAAVAVIRSASCSGMMGS